MNRATMSYMTPMADYGVTFEASVPHGKGQRYIGVTVKREILLQLAEAIKRNPNSIGHAVWHVQDGERAFPCSSCEP